MSHLERNLRQLEKYGDAIDEALKLQAKVGLPAEKIGGQVYGGGMTVLQIGAIHEFGAPEAGIRRRSWMANSVKHEQKAIDKQITGEFEAIFEGRGKDAKAALTRVALVARNAMTKAFSNQGYGTWRKLKPATVKRKGSALPLVDTGVLRGAITWVIGRK